MQCPTPAFQPYNLFRPWQHPGLFCAVRQDQPVPSFVRDESWSFGGTVTARSRTPAGFTLAAADEAMRFTGYYLFQAPKG